MNFVENCQANEPHTTGIADFVAVNVRSVVCVVCLRVRACVCVRMRVRGCRTSMDDINKTIRKAQSHAITLELTSIPGILIGPSRATFKFQTSA